MKNLLKRLIRLTVIFLIILLPFLYFKPSVLVISTSNNTDFSKNNISTNEQATSPLFQIFLSGLGGSLFGALTGGFISSYMHAHYSRRDISEKEHFKDLKEKSIEPLIKELSSHFYNHPDSSTLISNNILELNTIKKFNDILFLDLVNNHYPEINSKLKSIIELNITTINIKNNLENKMRNYLEDKLKFENINQTETFKNNWITTFINYKINGYYDDSFIRIWQNYEQRKLYIHHNYDSIKHLVDDENYLIFASTYDNEKMNIERINEIRNKIIYNINNCIIEYKELEKDYHIEEQKMKFIREYLLNILLQIKYSTKLVFVKEEKDGMQTKKCRLAG